MAQNPAEAPNADRLVSAVEREYGISYADEQLKAVRLAASCRAMVLTGGPGDGQDNVGAGHYRTV